MSKTLKVGSRVRVLYDSHIGYVTYIERFPNGAPFKIYVKHRGFKRSIAYYPNNIELYEKV